NENIDCSLVDVVSYSDYYPFGMQMPGRNGQTDAYRYGAANGQEKVDEISGEGNHYTAEFWEYDPRIARRWNPDPIVKHHESPYAVFANNPIWFVDRDGADTSTVDDISFNHTDPLEVDAKNIESLKKEINEVKDYIEDAERRLAFAKFGNSAVHLLKNPITQGWGAANDGGIEVLESEIRRGKALVNQGILKVNKLVSEYNKNLEGVRATFEQLNAVARITVDDPEFPTQVTMVIYKRVNYDIGDNKASYNYEIDGKRFNFGYKVTDQNYIYIKLNRKEYMSTEEGYDRTHFLPSAPGLIDN
ncbi:hypothetical protein CW751_14975, partial [Brumimicrobium salinarum]